MPDVTSGNVTSAYTAEVTVDVLAIDVTSDADAAGAEAEITSAQAAGALLAGKRWRIEVTHGGKDYILRRGSKQDRESAPGGKFTGLSAERMKAYYARRDTRRRKAAERVAGGAA